MNNIKDWALRYCSDENITYDELIIKALELYKSLSSKDFELYKYVTSNEFINTIEKVHSIVKSNDNTLITKVITTEYNKKRFLARNKCEVSRCRDIINKEGTEIVVIQNRGDDIAFAIISYENEESEVGRYPFLHYLRIIREEYKKKFLNIEKAVRLYIKKKGYHYYDRIIDGEAEEENFQVVYNVYNIKLIIEEAAVDCLNYSIEEADIDRFRYVIEAKRGPERFNYTHKNSRKVILEDGTDFILCSMIKEQRALLTLMIMKERKNDLSYMKNVLFSIISILRKEGVKELYATISDSSYCILKSLGKLEVISREKWVRKIL